MHCHVISDTYDLGKGPTSQEAQRARLLDTERASNDAAFAI
jgi:hypothetical protein